MCGGEPRAGAPPFVRPRMFLVNREEYAGPGNHVGKRCRKGMESMRRWLAVVAVAVSLLPTPVRAAPPAQAPCEFILGFRTLHDWLGAGTAGACLEDQRFAFNGNAEQLTTRGLMAWRKADNWTAF